MSAAELTIRLATLEIVHLTELIDQLLTVIGRAEAASDPAVRRLTPDVYPDDDEASAEFADATRDDLIDRRRADAQVVRAALAPALTTVGDDDHDTQEHEIRIALSALDAWLRTLTTLRLVIATRLNIGTDDDHDAENARFGVYDWLGYRLDRLVELADAHETGDA
ncbi:DUF2017 family protein [Microbacterium sp.]|uniref:DUF2017 family protein n=1 Tax=Microbacterium sp. TaxID=51671 RepID=UPI0026112ED3|nr:DUF2017 family protein [Microbacterium sp.]